MAATSKKKNLQKRVPDPEPRSNVARFFCYHCGSAFSRQEGNFPTSRSPMYRGFGYLPFCKECTEEMFQQYTRKLGSERAAMKRMCCKMDLYWDDAIYDVVERSAGINSKVFNYIAKTNIIRYVDKTYDDTLDKEEKAAQKAEQEAREAPVYEPTEQTGESNYVSIYDVSEDDLNFWGAGYPAEVYGDLNRRYAGWTSKLGTLTISEEAIYKQICILEMTIARDSASGRAIDKHVNALNNLLGSANLKPAQQKAEISEEFENMPLGVGIGRLETVRPVPKPDPEFEDVDGIVRYVTVWFLGHLCHMLGIRNTYCRLYEEEMARLRVTAPEFQDDSDDETLFDDIFGGGGDAE